jgi:ribosomal protein S19
MMVAFNIAVFSPRKYNLVEVTQEIIEHYLYGLATLKGHKLILKYKQARPDDPFGREKKPITHDKKMVP